MENKSFDRTAYWKQRIADHINSLFADMTPKMKEILGDVEHISPGNRNFRDAIQVVGVGFDRMMIAVEKIGVKIAENPPVGKPEKGTHEKTDSAADAKK